MLYTSKKVYESPNSTKTHYKTCTWNVRIPSNERRYRWATSRSMMLLVSSFSLRSLMWNILKVSSFYRKKVASLIFFSKLLIGNSNSRTRRNSPTRSAKDSASMVGGMFMVGIMSCWGERFSEVVTESRLLGTIPWRAMATCSVT
jgi:hypothetical protein